MVSKLKSLFSSSQCCCYQSSKHGIIFLASRRNISSLLLASNSRFPSAKFSFAKIKCRLIKLEVNVDPFPLDQNHREQSVGSVTRSRSSQTARFLPKLATFRLDSSSWAPGSGSRTCRGCPRRPSS